VKGLDKVTLIQEREGLREQIMLDEAQANHLWLSPTPDWFAIDRLLAHIAYCRSRLEIQNQSTM
jgi:hypothetical protein